MSSEMSAPWQQLLASTMTPTTAVAVKLAVTDEPPEPDPPDVIANNRRASNSFFDVLNKRIPVLSKLSISKTDQGTPLFRPEIAIFQRQVCSIINPRDGKR
ncbi:hypothetical protein M8J76_013624 [Diaphorina citri]|nr:hypothetical protein M8J75_003341 [Diaphorina citri]KAI5723971.1 hypothetical protein M8J76_013624 [Diaphorina citri]